MAIIINDNIQVNAGKPVENKYLNELNASYTGTSQVTSTISIPERYIGLTVNVNNNEYWFATGVTNSDLILKSNTGTTFNGIQNIGSGIGVLSGVTENNTYNLKSIVGSGNTSIINSGDTIVINSVSSGESYTFNNGLTESGGTVSLGGSVQGFTFEYPDGFSYDEHSWGATDNQRFRDYYIEGTNGNDYTEAFWSLGRIYLDVTDDGNTSFLQIDDNDIQLNVGGSSSSSFRMRTDGRIETTSSSRGLTIPRLSSDPTGQNGEVIYNTTSHNFKGYQNGVWVNLDNQGNNLYSVTGITSTTINLTGDEFVVLVDTSFGVTVNLPTTPSIGTPFKIKDKTGCALNNNIVIDSGSGNTIDDTQCAIINTNYGGVEVVYGDTNSWYVLSFVT